MEQPQKVIEIIGQELQETCAKMEELQAKMDDTFNQAKTDLGKLASVLIDLARNKGNEDTPETDV